MSQRQLEETCDQCDRCNSQFTYNHQRYPNNNINGNDNNKKYEQHDLSNNSNTSTLISQRELIDKISNSQLGFKENCNDYSYINSNITQRPSSSYEYMNNIKSIYEKEKEDLQSKIFSLSKAFESTRLHLTDQIKTLQNKLNDQESQSRLTMQTMDNQYSFELKRISTDKDNQIKLLSNKNKELSVCNEELIQKTDQYITMINDTKISLSANINNAQCEVQHLMNELKRQKDYYDNKIEYYRTTYEEEKNKIVHSYEDTIAQLNANYEESKSKFLKILESRNKDVKDAIDIHQSDHDKLIKANSEYKNQIDKLAEERIELIQQNQDQRFEIERFTQLIKQSKNETVDAVNERTNYEKQIDTLIRENESLKINNDKLNRLTHGKLK